MPGSEFWSDFKLVRLSFVKCASVVKRVILSNISIPTKHCPEESVSTFARWLSSHCLYLRRLRTSESTLETQGLGSHFARLSLFALHLEFLSFGKEVLNRCIKRSHVNHVPWPLIAPLCEVVPSNQTIIGSLPICE